MGRTEEAIPQMPTENRRPWHPRPYGKSTFNSEEIGLLNVKRRPNAKGVALDLLRCLCHAKVPPTYIWRK